MEFNGRGMEWNMVLTLTISVCLVCATIFSFVANNSFIVHIMTS